MKLFEDIYYYRSKELEDKLFRVKYKSSDLKTILERLNYHDLNEIAKEYLKDFVNLNKQDKINCILSNINQIINYIIDKMNLTHLEFIQSLLDNNGEITYEEKHVGLLSLFKSYGLCFPVLKRNKKTIIMPNEIRKSFHYLLTEMNIYLIEQNHHIIKYIRGLINLYGLLEVSFVHKKINQYLNTIMDETLLFTLIGFDSVINLTYFIKDEYIQSIFVTNDKDRYIAKRKEYNLDYYPFTDEEILKAGDINNLKKEISIKHDLRKLMKKYGLKQDESIEHLLRLYYALKDDISYNLLTPMLSTLVDPNNIENDIKLLIEISDNTPKWSLMGHKYHNLSIKNPLTIEKIISIVMDFHKEDIKEMFNI